MPRTIESREANFECLVPDNLPELFADGISQLQVGLPVTRILFHAITEPRGSGTPERRVAKLSLVIPTNALMELAANLATSTNKEIVDSTTRATQEYANHVTTQIGRLAELTALKESHKD